MESILRGLNKAQRAAVTSTASVLQVLAPPGSGKTKTLTSRVAYLLSHHGYAPPDVICCTFTIKASREMRERLRGMIGDELESRLLLGTFHSICRRYLVSYGHLIGLPKNFGIADSDDSLNIIKRAVKRLNLSIDARSARSRISHRKARGKKLDDLAKLNKNVETQEFVTIFQEYEDALKTSNLLDYDDLLLRCVELLKRYPGCVSNVEALLIDEFQDTNIVQFELMKLLASAKNRITIVGDPDQSIYGFRSAEIENLRRMRTYYPEAVVINLEENYRSCSSVLKLAQEIIEQDTERPDKKLKSTKRYGTLPVLRKLPNPFEEAQWIAAEIKRILVTTANMINYSDIAILLRSAYLSLHIEKALANFGIPYRMVGGRRFFDRVEIRILVDYLKTISHPDNNSALLATINTPKRKVGDATIKELTRTAELRKESIWTIIQKVLSGGISLDKKLPSPAERGLQDFMSLIQRAREKMDGMPPLETPSRLLEFVVNNLKYQDYLRKEHPEDHEERWENVQELMTQATDATLHFNVENESLPNIEGVTQDKSIGSDEVLARFLANVSLSTEVEMEDGEEKYRITISTIHSAKGLEWPVVFIPAVYEGSIPHSRAEDTNEERRLLYVAITRAKALLYMTFPIKQQRDESESVLTQFLTSNITPLVSKVGPVFHESIVNEVATILERQAPSNQELLSSLQTIKENESAEDDIWPADGGHRQRQTPMESAFPGVVLQQGQSLSDALTSIVSYGTNRKYSTTSHGNFGGDETSLLSTANLSTEFTTAHQHLRTQPQLPTEARITDAPGKTSSKRPRISKSVSDQGNIHSFFTQGTLISTPELSAVRGSSASRGIQSEQSVGKKNTGDQSARPVERSIPPHLSGHRPLSGSTGFRRSQSMLNSTTANELNRKRNHYTAFETSSLQVGMQEQIQTPNSEGACDPVTIGKAHIPSVQRHQSDLSDLSQSRGSSSLAERALLTKTSTSSHMTTMTQLHARSKLSNICNPNPRLVGTNTLHGNHLSASVKTTMNILQTSNSNGIRNKTLGVRRSLSGWDNRKHK